jgi:trigger factor
VVSQAESGISVRREALPGSQLSLEIEVPRSRVDAAYERVLGRLAQRVKIEGFRPGKAPRQLVEARLGEAALRSEVIESLVPVVVNEAIRDGAIDAIDRPRVDVLELQRGRAGRLTATVSVMPAITIPDLAALRVPRPTTEVDDKMVRQRIDELLERLAELAPVEREVREGDVVIADVEVLVEGAPIESQARKAIEVEVKEGRLIPELRHALPGTAIDSTAEATVRMPHDHPEPALAGQEAVFRLTVRGVKEKRVPALDAEVASRLSDGEHTTEEAFTAAVRADLEEQARRLDELAYEQNVLQEVVNRSQVEVPPVLVDREVERQLDELSRRLNQQGLRLETYLAYSKQTPEQWLEQARPDAESRLKIDLVLGEVSRREGIEPSETEVLDYMQSEAAGDAELAQQVAELTGSPAARDYFRHRLQRLRTLELLVKRAQEATQQ